VDRGNAPSAAPKLNLFSAGVSLSLRSKLCVPQSKLAKSWCNLASRWLLLEALVGGVPPGVASPEENCAAEEYRLCDDEPTGDAMVYLVVMVLAGDYNDCRDGCDREFVYAWTRVQV
jgi:hypothetical protein